MAVLLAIICALAIGGIYLFRTRGGGKPSDLVSYLPVANATVLYVDVDAIRRSGILSMIAGSKAAQELEYRQFVEETLFDYREDLDAVAAAFKDGQVFFALRGRFHWKNLMDYAVREGGSCHNSFCTVPTSRPNRRASFYPLRPNIMAIAFSSDDGAAYQITRKASKFPLASAIPEQPAWMLVPALALKDAELPAGTKAYASALLNAQQIVFSLGPDGDHLRLALNVTTRDAEAASALLVDFENTTSTLRKWLAREHQTPNSSDLSGILVAGAFRRDDRHVYGEWPLWRSFIDSLAGGAY
jgi:hypothetical protein